MQNVTTSYLGSNEGHQLRRRDSVTLNSISQTAQNKMMAQKFP